MQQHQNRREYSLEELLDKLGLTYSSKYMDCPSCGRKKSTRLDLDSDKWNCLHCDTGGGVIKLYAYIHEGVKPRECPSPKTKEYKSLVYRLHQFMDNGSTNTRSNPVPTQQVKKKDKIRIYPAPDDYLDTVYQALMNIPELNLLPSHKELLLKRGLTEQAIEQNGYRSIPEAASVPKLYYELYLLNGGKYPSSHKADSIRLGLYIADKLVQQGLTLKGVPGFYKFGVHWCYWCIPGILIPTRNHNGQIVIWQIRKDKLRSKKEAKYLTVSCQDLPGAVTESVSRCHFPIGNAPLDGEAPLLITEGPLKADVACHLYNKPVAFAAIPGINTTKDLLSLSPVFLEKGKRKVYNALDMDRLTNPNVRNGCEHLREDFRVRGIIFTDLFWGDQYATSKLMQLSLLARSNGICVHEPANASVFHRLLAHIIALENAGITPYRVTTKKDGSEEKHYWDPDTKGIDDYLFSTKNI